MNQDSQNRFTYHYPEINGLKQFIAISNGDTNLPLLVFLHGGPGMVVSPILDNIFEWL